MKLFLEAKAKGKKTFPPEEAEEQIEDNKIMVHAKAQRSKERFIKYIIV